MTKELVIREPHPWPQTEVLTRNEQEILYWWARGWGKTDAGIVWMSEEKDNPDYRWLVLRHTYDDLRDWIDRAMRLYTHFGAKEVGNPSEIIFPSGAVIRTGYLKDMKSFEKYRWHEYARILIEELTQIPSEDLYVMLLGSLRSTTWIKPQILCTTNPDGVGRLRVKRRFVDVTEPGTRYTDEFGNSRIFIPARVTDNPTLMEKDPAYIQKLKAIKDDQLRKAWLEWDRDAYDIKWGIYTAQIKQAREEQRICKVPYDPNLKVHTVRDLGVSDYTAIIFYQRYGKENRVIDAYYNEGEWLWFYAQVLQDKKYNYWTHFAPHDIRVRELWTWKTRIDQAREYGVDFTPVPMVEVRDGINKARQTFAECWFDRENCKTLMEHLEIYRKEFDENHQVFKDKPFHWVESHFADAFRYLALSIQEPVNEKWFEANHNYL